MDRVMAIIPARSGSKGVIDKNVKELGGHPLVAYSIAVAQCSTEIDRVVVSTDSELYAEVARRYGAEVPFLRPAAISGDASTDYEFFQHALNWMVGSDDPLPDLLVHLRPTTPLRETKIIDEAVDYMRSNKQATALRSAYKTHLTPYKMFKRSGEYMRPFMKFKDIEEFYNLPRQIFEDAYIPNGYVDIVRTRVLRETPYLHGPDIKLVETDQVPDIDTLEEFDRAESLLTDARFEEIIVHLKEYRHE